MSEHLDALRARSAAAWEKRKAEPRLCDYCDAPPTHRVRWTAYGGVTVGKNICARHAERARGQRGVEVTPLAEPQACVLPDTGPGSASEPVVVVANGDQAILEVGNNADHVTREERQSP